MKYTQKELTDFMAENACEKIWMNSNAELR